MLYGPQGAIILGALAGISSALRISKRPKTVLFAGAALACAILVTSQVLQVLFGSTAPPLHRGASVAIVAVCVMGLTQYLAHTGIVAIANALKDNQSIWQMWTQNFLWISVTYFSGAAASTLIVLSIGTIGFYAFLAAVPIIVIVYLQLRSLPRRGEEVCPTC